jgi:glycosyltransferase involved in cell wall biosynthesis
MKVLFVSTHLRIGGVERQWSILLPGLRDRGFDVRLLTLTAEGPFFNGVREAGIQADCARMRHRWDLLGLRRALEIARWEPTVVVSNSVLGTAVAHAIARRAKAAHIATDHSIVPELSTTQRLVRRMLAGRVDAVVAVTKKQIPALVAAGYRRQLITVVPSGIPPLEPERDRSATRVELGLRDEDFAVFLIATLRPEKRADFFLDAVRAAHALDSRIRGVIVGLGPDLQRMRSRASGTDGVVQVLGGRGDVPELIGSADLVCLSSSSEALPMTVIEAMAAGRPVLATDVGGTSDLVVDGETGILVAPDDQAAFIGALTELADDSALVERFGQAGRERHARLFTADRMVDAYTELLDQNHVEAPRTGGRDMSVPSRLPSELRTPRPTNPARPE